MIPKMTDDIESYLLVAYYLREDDTGQPTVLQQHLEIHEPGKSSEVLRNRFCSFKVIEYFPSSFRKTRRVSGVIPGLEGN